MAMIFKMRDVFLFVMNTVRLDLLALKSDMRPSDCSRRIALKIETLKRQLPGTMLEHIVSLLIDEYDKLMKLGFDPGIEAFLSSLPDAAQFVRTMFEQVAMHGEIFPLPKGTLIELRGGRSAQRAICEEILLFSASGIDIQNKGQVESAFGLTLKTISGMLREAIEYRLLAYLADRDFSKTRVAHHMTWVKSPIEPSDREVIGQIFGSVNYSASSW